MTQDHPGFPDTPGLDRAVAQLSRGYDAAERQQKAAEQRERLNIAAPQLLDALRNFTDGREISYVEALQVARRAIASATVGAGGLACPDRPCGCHDGADKSPG